MGLPNTGKIATPRLRAMLNSTTITDKHALHGIATTQHIPSVYLLKSSIMPIQYGK